MFLSIKWKVLLFLTLILLSVSLTWLGISVNKDLHSFQQELNEKKQRQNVIFQQLLDDEFLKLSQYAHLIINVPQITKSESNVDPIAVQQYLNENAFNWGLNLSLDFLAIVDADQQIMAETSQLTPKQSSQLKQAIYPKVADAFVIPQNLTFCLDACWQLVLEPFRYASGKIGVIIYGQSMAQIVYRYAYLSGSDIAIAISHNGVHNEVHKEADADKTAYKLWAMSNHPTLAQTLDLYHPNGERQSLSLLDLLEKQYFFNTLSHSDLHFGHAVNYINVFSDEDRVATLKLELLSSLQSALLVFLIAEIVFVLLLLGPLRKIRRLAMIYQDLPKGNYQRAISLVSKTPSFFKDELSSMEQHTLALANELKGIDDKVALSKQELAEQVQLLTSSQDYLHRLFDQSNLLIVTLNADYSISSSNRNFKLQTAEKPKETFWLNYFLHAADKASLKHALDDIAQAKMADFQMLVAMTCRQQNRVGETIPLKVLWNLTKAHDAQGGEKLLAIGMPLTQLGFMEEKRTQEPKNSTALDNDEFNDYVLNNKNALLRCLQANHAKPNLLIKYQPLLAIKHLAINEYSACVSFTDNECAALDYSQVQNALLQDFDWISLDIYLLESVLEFCDKQRETHPQLEVTVPISAYTLVSNVFEQRLSDLQSDFPQSLDKINFEIIYNQPLISIDFKVLSEQVRRLQDRGHKIILRLLSVEQLPLEWINALGVDVVKFNLELFQQAISEQALPEKIEHLMAQAHAHKCMTIFEGVNDKFQFEALKKASVDWAQGVFIREAGISVLNSLDIVAIQSEIKNLP